jgi:CubicO group peptidase (beta-lactamase class C family)
MPPYVCLIPSTRSAHDSSPKTYFRSVRSSEFVITANRDPTDPAHAWTQVSFKPCSERIVIVGTWKNVGPLLALAFAILGCPIAAVSQAIPSAAVIDAEVSKIMTDTHAKGMAIAVIDHGEVGYVQAYGSRNAKGDPLTTDTVMYGASVTKTVFAYTVMQFHPIAIRHRTRPQGARTGARHRRFDQG